MRPINWRPPVEFSATEQTIIKRIRRGKLSDYFTADLDKERKG